MAHIHELIDFTAEVFVVYKNKVLLRYHDKYHLWLSVGGHIELHEDPNQAAIREVKEEVGLDIELFAFVDNSQFNRDGYEELIPPVFMNKHKINETHKHVTLVYFAKSHSDQLILSETEKSERCEWFSLEQLDDPKYTIKDHVKMYAKAALSKVK